MQLSDKRAIKIVELQEQLDEAKKIIEEFVWPSDATSGQRRRFSHRAALFAGCQIPQYKASEDQNENEHVTHDHVTPS
ncbi:MAG: hypothetical protein ACOCWG_00775 [bacterium]